MLHIEVCTSSIITSTWLTSLYGYGSRASVRLQLDRPLLSKQHQIIGELCSTSNSTVYRAISNFNETTLISLFLLSRASLKLQMNVIIKQLIQQTPLELRRLTLATKHMLQGNLIATAFSTDWLTEYGNASNDYVLRNVPRRYSNSTCNCAVSDECREPLKIGPPDLVLPGLYIGCYPIDGLRMSTFECFFSASCINTILSYLDYYTLPDGSPPINFSLPEVLSLVVEPFNDSISSRFSKTTPVGTIIDDLFAEEWENITSFEKYYAACSPMACTYEFTERRGILYVLTSLLALYGGLTVGLRMMVWNGVRLHYRGNRDRHTRHIRVAPRSSNN